jgi:hypothetical protein
MNRITTIVPLVQQVQLSVRTHCHHPGADWYTQPFCSSLLVAGVGRERDDLTTMTTANIPHQNVLTERGGQTGD